MPAIPVLAIHVEHSPHPLLLGAILMLVTVVIQTFGLIVTCLLMFAWSTSALVNQMSWITEVRRDYLLKHRRNGSRESAGPPLG